MTQTPIVETKGVAEQIQTAVRKGELTLPPLPEIATRLLGMLRDETTADLGTIARLMQNDPALTASGLRIANSASFGGFGSVPDLDQAIPRLGLKQVGTLVTSLVHKGNFRSDNPARIATLHRLWDHTLASAFAARDLAAMGEGDRTEAYLAGLLHDSGKLLVLKGLDEIEKRSPTVRFSSEEVNELMAALHTVLGYSALQAWKIADSICKVALHHHDTNVPAANVLLIRVQAADLIATKLCWRTNDERDLDLLGARPIEVLGLEGPELDALLVAVEEEITRVRGLFATV